MAWLVFADPFSRFTAEFSISKAKPSAHAVIEQMVWAVSTYAIPLLVAVVTLVALWSWTSPYDADEPLPHEIRVLAPSESPPPDPAAAYARLADAPPNLHWDTRLSEKPIWFGVRVPATTEPGGRRFLEFPSRHAVDIRCWSAPDMLSLGDATRVRAFGTLLLRKSSFAMTLLGDSAIDVLCQGHFIGPARISAMLWSGRDFDRSVRRFDRNVGLLDGGLTLMSIFLLTAAVINRRALYLVFAAWLFLAMRIGGLSMGWDMQWLGHSVPPEWLPRGRALSIAFYAVILLTLHRSLFRDALAGSRFDAVFRWLHRAGFVLVAAAATLPYGYFLPFMWILGGSILVTMCASLPGIVRRSHSRVALWYSAALGISVLANLVEIVAAATGHREILGVVNSVTAAMASSLLASLAVAEQMRQEHMQRVQAQADLQHTFDATPIGLFTLDLVGNFTSANPALQRILGLADAPSQRAGWAQQFGEDSLQRLRNIAGMPGDGAELEIQGVVEPDGDVRRFLVKATLARGKIEGSLQDVTEKSLAAENLRFLVDHDPLTRALNRRGVEKALQDAFDHMEDDGGPVAVAYLDLDRFKLLNDLFGHAAGDQVLQHVCDRIQRCLPPEMAFGRVGGDEFVVVMAGMDLGAARVLGLALVEAVGAAAYQIADKAFQVRVSVGVVEVAPYHHVKTVLLAADRACRQAKAGSRGNGLVAYEKDAAVFREHAVELQLMEQIAGDRIGDHLFLAMQPIMSLQSPTSALNFEVLLRMRDTEGRMVPTPQLIHAAESTGRMSVIDRWVLNTTLVWLDAHRSRLAATQFVCMNLSGASLNDERFIEDVFCMLVRYAHIAHWLCFEVTESVALHDLQKTREFIDRVRGYGAKVALDDFGAGYTSFAYLRELPADVLKIDGNFIVDMNSHPANIAIVEAIVNLARNLGMKTIAEWAEDAETVRTLVELGVDYVQGYVVARPQAPEALLTVSSAAGFIADENLRRLVDDLQALNVPAQIGGSLKPGSADPGLH